jgi:hypothetical protein
MREIIGNFRRELPEEQEFLVLSFSPTSIPIQQRWRNNGLSADFVADYLTTFFPISDDDPDSQQRQEEIKGAVSFIANELLENAMKFHDNDSDYPIKFEINLLEEDEVTVILQVRNSINSHDFDKFSNFIQELTNSDPDDFYLRQLEKSAEDENSTASGVGLLTMINDYGAKLGWQFEKIETPVTILIVTTMVQLKI